MLFHAAARHRKPSPGFVNAFLGDMQSIAVLECSIL
jgi:hypothetical protein